MLDRSVELAKAVGDDRLLGRLENTQGTVLSEFGRTDEALDAYTRSIPLLDAADDLLSLSRSLNNRAYIYGVRGQSNEAFADLERALSRYTVIRPCLYGEPCGVSALPARTLSRWLALYREAEASYGAGLLGLIPRCHARGNRAPRLPEQTRLLEAVRKLMSNKSIP